MIITFSSAIIFVGGVIMIDLATPIDTLPLFNFSHHDSPKKRTSFAYIFFDNYDYLTHLYNIGKLRPVCFDNIQKTILCHTIYLGCDFFQCPKCGKETMITHSCHSHFCTQCGAKETKQRSAFVSTMALEAKHRHIVFTIPWEMREYLIRHRVLLDDLLTAARNTLACLFNDTKYRKNKNRHKNDLFYKKKTNKSKYAYKDDRNKVVFGAVMTLHTFGRNLQWNPHVHCLVCEEAYDTLKKKLKNFSFMSYEKLRKTWMYQVLDIISPKLGKDFQRLKKDLYRICEDGFYVWAKPNEHEDDDIEKCVQYITRYTSRPPMAESRIVSYDPSSKQIHWFYNRHKNDKRVDVHEHVYDFLNRLILHCPEKNFKMTRYYGFYSNKCKPLLEKIYELYSKKVKKRKIKTSQERKKLLKKKLDDLKYRCHMIQSYCKDPILCSCGEIMKPSGQYNPFEGGKKNDRRYRNRSIRGMGKLERGRDIRVLRT